ncbi:MAG: LPS assembly protein LptD [Pseudomonadota bacterium]
MNRAGVAFAVVLLSMLVAGAATAQARATLIADQLEVIGRKVLRAEGNVEVLYDGRRLTATAVEYNQETNQIRADGPLRLVEGTSFIVLGSFAELDDRFQNGIIDSARLVLEEELQISANELVRVNGRYSQLTRTVASTCQVCTPGQAPLWQIRARRVVHDAELKRLYFDHALFEVLGLPVFYLPRLRMPDPSVDRAEGFLLPGLRSSNRLGQGILVPYFYPIGDRADITATPYVSDRTTTLGLRYRQLFRNGAIHLSSALSEDDLTESGGLRGFLFGEGKFFLRDGFQLDFGLQFASDDSYLSDYSISNQDRSRSDVTLSRVDIDTAFSASGTYFRTFRESERNRTIPSAIGDVSITERGIFPLIGGQSEFRFRTYGFRRDSDQDVIGRDYGRISTSLAWRDDKVFGPGLKAEGLVRLNADYYLVSQDSTESSTSQFTPEIAAGLRWPFERTAPSGARQVLEPRAQLAWSTTDGVGLTDEEGTLVDFDEGNLFGLSRIPGANRYEEGGRLNLGLGFSHHAATGWTLDLTGGRVWRTEDQNQFTAASGLSGTQSDWLASVRLQLPIGLNLISRSLIDDGGGFTKNESALSYRRGPVNATVGYLWLIAEPEADREQESNEVSFSAGYAINRNWQASAGFRYDLVADRAARTLLGVSYRNECIEVDVSYRESFTQSDAVEPNSRFDFLVGLPTGGSVRERRQRCYG